MPFLPAPTTLLAATLSGAAVREGALGGDPARVTTAPDVLRENGGIYNGVVFDVDNTHYWTSDFAQGTQIVKRLISTGVAVLTVTIPGSGPMGMQRWIDTDGIAYLLVGCYSLFKVARIRMSDGAYTLSAVLANRPVGVCKLPSSVLDGPMWVLDSYNDTGVVREIDFATGAILRTIGAAQWGNVNGNVADRLVLANNSAVSLYDTAPTTPALLYTFSFVAPTLIDGSPGTSINASATTSQPCIPPRGVAVGPGNTIYVLLGDGMVDRLDIATGTFTRVRSLDPERDGASLPQSTGYRWSPFLDFSPDGKWMAECVAEGVTTQSVKWHRFTRIDDAVAEWTFTIPSGGEVTIDTFAVPGCLGNSKGRASARQRAERAVMAWDDRRTLLEYSVDGGATWVAVGNGERVLSGGLPVTCAAGVAPRLRAKLKPPSWLKPAAPRPWIAASDGLAGPTLWYEDLSANVYVPVQTATVRGALLQQPMLRGRMSP